MAVNGEDGAVSEGLRDLQADLERELEGEVRFDRWTRHLYSTDASIYRILPLGVVFPRSEEDVSRTIRLCAARGLPVLPRGDGSSLAGQAVGEAVVIDFSRHLDGVIGIDPEGRSVITQPGISLARVNRYTAAHALIFGPDPASADRATIGGVIGNNATGAHSILYGMTRDHVRRLRVVLADGTPACFEKIPWEQARRRAGLPPPEGSASSSGGRRAVPPPADLETAIWREVVQIAEEGAETVRRSFPRTWRRAAGYNLDLLRPGEPVDLPGLIAGSEGTLCVITEAELGLVRRPAATSLAMLAFDDLLDALGTVPALLEQEPTAIELMDSMLLGLCRRAPGFAHRLTFVEGEPQALLAVEVFGETEHVAEREAHLERLVRAARSACTGPVAVRILHDGQQQDDVWTVRKAGLGLLMSRRGDHKPIPFIEDTAVPPDSLRAYVADLLGVLRTYDAPAAFYAHASAGCLHIRPLINLKDAAEIAKMEAITLETAALVRSYGGTMSGEHGDGLALSGLHPFMFGSETVRLFERLKDAFDPAGIMNPGKIVRPPALTSSLRFGPDYRTEPVTTFFDFTADGGFARAVEMCNGEGVCRKMDEGTMCPSFMATRDEEHSTRGRANALREVLSGAVPSSGLTDDRLLATLDLCLQCKACRSECPSQVDMTRLKSELLAQRYERLGVPLRARFFGGVARIGRLASDLAPISNRLAARPVVRRLLERWVGIDRRRSLPTFHFRTLQRRMEADTRVRERLGEGPGWCDVWLLADPFTDRNDPQVGMAAVRLLRAAGARVRLLPLPGGSEGRAELSRGLLPRARQLAEENVRRWTWLVEGGDEIVGVEPSSLLTLRDEYPALVPGEAAERVAAASFLVEEWLVRHAARVRPLLRFRPPATEEERHLLVHGHCHQKALAGEEALQEVLSWLPGTHTELLDAGCCGMAGSFGYETEHYELSMAIGGQRLFPAIEALKGGGTVVAPGTSCRHQILDGTGRRAVHPVEVLTARLEAGV
jgi:FAD/FMN-containing dehydrogenase/Fe-S oxidoreductase